MLSIKIRLIIYYLDGENMMLRQILKPTPISTTKANKLTRTKFMWAIQYD